MTYTPGPANILLMGTAIQSGLKKTIPMFLGIISGFLVVAVLIILGLGEIFKIYPIILEIIRVLGTFYLLYLAYKIYQSRNRNIKGKNTDNPTFLRGLLVHPLSPKAWMMLVSGYAQFINIEQSILAQSIIIIAVFIVSGASGNFIWMFTGSVLQQYLRNQRAVYWTYTILTVSLIILIISMWF